MQSGVPVILPVYKSAKQTTWEARVSPLSANARQLTAPIYCSSTFQPFLCAITKENEVFLIQISFCFLLHFQTYRYFIYEILVHRDLQIRLLAGVPYA